MLKRIPKSDISIRPFKAYKEWSFDNNSIEISLLEADSTSTDLSGLYPKNSIYGNIKSTFYNGKEDNLITRIGFKTNNFTIFTKAKERNLESYAKVISIPNIYIGEGIKKKSVIINDGGSFYIDDGYGNLRGIDVGLELEIVNFNNNFIKYLNLENSLLTLGLVSLNLETNEVIFNYNSINYTQIIIPSPRRRHPRSLRRTRRGWRRGNPRRPTSLAAGHRRDCGRSLRRSPRHRQCGRRVAHVVGADRRAPVARERRHRGRSCRHRQPQDARASQGGCSGVADECMGMPAVLPLLSSRSRTLVHPIRWTRYASRSSVRRPLLG